MFYHKVFFLFSIYFLLFSVDVCATDKIEVVIDGVEGDVRKNIISFLSIEQQKMLDSLSDERIKKLFNKGYKEIQQAIQPFGFYKAKITGGILKIATGWKAHYIIELGPPVHISIPTLFLE